MNQGLLYLGPGNTPHDRRFVQALAGAGWNVTAVCTAGSSTITACSRVSVLEALIAGEAGAAWLREVADAMRPDVVLAGPVPTNAAAAARARLHPLIAVSWGSDLLIDARQNEEARAAADFALQNADAVFVDCAAVLRIVDSFRTFSPERVLQMPWGVDRDIFFPAPPGRASSVTEDWNAGAFVIFSNRTMADLYRVDVVVRAFASAHRRCPRMRLLLLGDGPRQSQLRSLAAELGVEESVRFAGRVAEHELVDDLHAAGLYVSASSSDGSSISLLQAMACGVPVAVTDLPSNAEWITADETGWLFPVGDSEALASAMLAAEAMSDDRRGAMVMRNIDVIAARADWNANRARLSAFCASLVAA